jgi:hypothetical protein
MTRVRTLIVSLALMAPMALPGVAHAGIWRY